MIPKEKAKELIDKYINASFNCTDCDTPYCDIKCTSLSIFEAKLCVLIAVNEILEVLSKDLNPLVNYWFEVKREIKKYETNTKAKI